MRKNKKSSVDFKKPILAILLTLMLVSLVHGESKLQIISDNLYMITGFGGNVGFLVGEKSILVVDGGYTPSYGKQITDLIKTVSEKPIEYVILTHYHPDHVRGVQSLLGSAKVIAHEELVSNLTKHGKERLHNDIENRYPEYITDLKNQITNYVDNTETTLAELKESLTDAELQLAELQTIELVTPDITFSDSLIIELDDNRVILNHFGSGHTSGNTIVHFIKQKTVHLGDLFFNDAFPYIDYEAGSNTENWITILNNVINWDLSYVIPGHGELSDIESIQKEINYLTDLRAAVSQAILIGKTLEESKIEIKLEDYNHYNWPYYLSVGIDAVYKELKKSNM
ncbi:MBL fold metallo-hydrolase [Candidatus Neomarinimicrobiota bacterium]